MEIEHRPCRKHGNADSLSRLPCRQCDHCDNKDSESDQVIYSVDVSIASSNEKDNPSMTLDELQNSDPSIQTVKKWIKEKKIPLSKDFVGNYFLQSLWNHFDRLSIENRLVFQRWDSVGTDQSHYQAVVPMKERRNILKYCHDVRSSGHLGVTKTLARVRQRFY